MIPLKSVYNEFQIFICRLVYRHPIKAILITFGITALLYAQLPNFNTDFSDDTFFRKDDPTLTVFKAFKDQFGADKSIIVAIHSSAIFTEAFLMRLTDLHNELERAVPHVTEVSSLINARRIYAEESELIIEDLIPKVPTVEGDLNALSRIVLTSKQYPNLYISEDGKLTAILLKLDTYSSLTANTESRLTEPFNSESELNDAEETSMDLTDTEAAQAVLVAEHVASQFTQTDFSVIVTGGPVVNHFYETRIMTEQGKFFGVAFTIFVVLLYAVFRRFSGVILTLLITTLSVTSTLSIMAISSTPFSLAFMALPLFLLAICICDSLHIFTQFFILYESPSKKEETIVNAFNHSGLPVLLTSLTTAAGLIAFASAELASIADFGIFGGIGVILAWVYTIILIPAFVAILPLKPKSSRFHRQFNQFVDTSLTTIVNISIKRPIIVLTISLILIVSSMIGLKWQRFSHNINEWLPHGSRHRENINLIDDKLKGVTSLEILVDTHVENGLYEPSIIQAIDGLGNYAKSLRIPKDNQLVGYVGSIADVLKEINQALNGNIPDFYSIPDKRTEIAQELLLFENSGHSNMGSLVDTNLSQARLSLKVRNDDAMVYTTLVDLINQKAKLIFPEDVTVTITGSTKISSQITHMVMATMARSYTIAFMIITVLMIFFLKSLRAGLISLIPNLVPILFTLGLMGWMGVFLDMSNMMMGTLAMGLVVDDTIHFLHNYRTCYLKHQDTPTALIQTILTTGRAIVFTSLILVSGFSVYLISEFPPIFNLGFSLSVVIAVALLADFFLLPTLLIIFSKSINKTLQYESGRNYL